MELRSRVRFFLGGVLVVLTLRLVDLLGGYVALSLRCTSTETHVRRRAGAWECVVRQDRVNALAPVE